jgi:prevent-host-death family protein
MTDTVNLYDAKTNLSKLVDRAAAGEEIIIAKAGKPKARLVPYQPRRKKRRFGRNLLGIT